MVRNYFKTKLCKLINKLFLILVIFLSGIFTSECIAQKLYKTTWKQFGTIFGSSAAMFGGSQIIQNRRGPITLEDLANLDSETIFSIDQGSIGNFSEQAGINSDHFKNGIWVAPITLFLSKQARENAKEIMMMYTEVFSLNSGITFLTKGVVGRYRPYAYNPNAPLDLKLSSTTRRSFFSGHVSHVASLSFFTASVFNDLYPDSKYKYLVLAGAFATPAITGYLRYRAGRHFPSDIIVGYGVGALIGYFIPKFHKLTKDSNLNIVGAENGLGLVYTF